MTSNVEIFTMALLFSPLQTLKDFLALGQKDPSHFVEMPVIQWCPILDKVVAKQPKMVFDLEKNWGTCKTRRISHGSWVNTAELGLFEQLSSKGLLSWEVIYWLISISWWQFLSWDLSSSKWHSFRCPGFWDFYTPLISRRCGLCNIRLNILQLNNDSYSSGFDWIFVKLLLSSFLQFLSSHFASGHGGNIEAYGFLGLHEVAALGHYAMMRPIHPLQHLNRDMSSTCVSRVWVNIGRERSELGCNGWPEPHRRPSCWLGHGSCMRSLWETSVWNLCN